jgi:primosomal protein N' (replication factor Y)
MIQVILDQKKEWKKSIVFYNRRWSSRALICQDCGYFEKCPHCDIAFAYHTTPKKQLICHQCSATHHFSLECSQCGWNHLNPVGIGIQRLEADLQSLLPENISFLRIDSDNHMKDRQIFSQLDQSDVLLMTHRWISLTHPNIGAVIFPCFEINLSLPDYAMEEALFHEILHFKKQGLPIYLQTYTPENPFLQEILSWNQKTFIEYLIQERKKFQYPPFAQFATLRIHDEQKQKVQDIIIKLVNKISLLKKDSTFCAFDHDIWEKHAGEWVQKIILKDTDLSYLLETLEIEIVRNRAVTLDWG